MDEQAASSDPWHWIRTTVWLPSEAEIHGARNFGGYFDDGLKLHYPLYAYTENYRIKRYNGGRMWWWTRSTTQGMGSVNDAACFGGVYIDGGIAYYAGSAAGGCAPAFCVA
jgi:hypothetical protein